MSSPLLTDWLHRLSSFSAKEIELGLDRVDAVYERMGRPRAPRVLTVGGTNGKGSTVGYLVAFLMRAGLRVGAYTSPHLHVYNERVRINDRLATDEELIAGFERVESARGDTRLTYFEYGTLAALAVFDTADIDVAVLEVGLGGRLDAVNVIDADGAIVTNVSLDHCDWLGDTVAEIALEKAGIYRRGHPAVFGDDRNVPDTLVQRAGEIGARLALAGTDYRWTNEDDRWTWFGATHTLVDLPRPSLRGDFQLANAAGALALLEATGFERALEHDGVSRALIALTIPARMQRVKAERQWLFDVAHNPAAASALAAALGDSADEASSTLAIVGMLDDKDTDSVIAHLAGVVDTWVAVTPDSPRAVPAAELARRVSNATGKPCLVADSPEAAVAYASGTAPADGRIVVTGSFFTVGPVQRALGLYSPSPRAQS